MADYNIWFKVPGFEELKLPVNPQEVAISNPANPTNYDVEGIGQIIIPRIPNLATLSIESFFPRTNFYQTMINGDSWYSPEWYVAFFKKLQRSKQPFELTISRGSPSFMDFTIDTTNEIDEFDTVMNAVLLDLTFTDKGGEPGDVYYSMTISEYRDASPKRLAEIVNEQYDDNGDLVGQEMVMVKDRPQQDGAIVADRPVQVTGKVYNEPDEKEEDWKMSRQKASQIDRVVSRVLPPQVSGMSHSIYISGLGWVDKGSCLLADRIGLGNSISRLVNNND